MLVCFQRESYLTLYEKKLIYGQEHAKLKGVMMTDAFEEHKTLRSAELPCNLNVFDYFPVSVPFLTMVCGMTENPFVVNLELQSNVKLGSYSAFTCHVTIGPV